jgi:RNA polymerase sigma-70 factor (ECF subfamily)
MLAHDMRLDLPGRPAAGSEATAPLYLANYGARADWRLVQGWVDGRPAILVYDLLSPDAAPAYFTLIEWSGGKVTRIRDYRYSRHVMAEALVREA